MRAGRKATSVYAARIPRLSGEGGRGEEKEVHHEAESGGGGGGRSAAHASQINVHYLQSVKSELPFSVVKRLS